MRNWGKVLGVLALSLSFISVFFSRSFLLSAETYFSGTSLLVPFGLAGVVQRTAACSHEPASTELPISASTLNRRPFEAPLASLAVEDRCFRVGDVYRVSLRFSLDPVHRVYLQSDLRVKVKEIRRLDRAASASDDEIQKLRYVDQTEFRAVVGSLPNREWVYSIEFEYSSGPKGLVDRGGKLESDFFQTLDWNDPILASAGVRLIDVRSPNEFSVSHAKNAINSEYRMASPDGASLTDWYESFRSRDRFDRGSLPSDKSFPLAFYGADLLDPRALRALLTASHEGHNHLYWIRSGEAGRTHAVLPAFLSDPHVERIGNADQLLELSKRLEIRVIDVEDNHVFLFHPLMLNAVSVPYGEAGIQESRLPRDKSLALVFYGEDRFDVRPLNAARIAWKEGWKNVYVYQGGRMDWEARSLQ